MLKLHTIRLALVAGLFLAAGSAHALTYCDDKNPCPSGKECLVAVCVPSTSICTADASCKGYQSCDFTCKVSSGGTIGTTTPVDPADAGVAFTDGGSSSGGSGGSGGSDQKQPPDASGSVDAGAIPVPDDAYTPPPVPACPKDKGVCIADAKKITPQPGCTEFCKTMATCGGLGGSSTSGSSGGGSGEVPPTSVDGGPSGFAQQDAGETVDVAAYPDAQPMDMNVEGPDTSVETTQAQIDMCIQMCSVIKLGGYITKEWGALEQCVLDNIGKCDDLNSKCQGLSEPVGNAFDGNETLAIDLLGMNFGSATTGTTTSEGDTKGSDNADTTSAGAPRYPGDTSADALGSSDAKSATVPPSSASSSGCTSGSTGGSLGGLAGLIGLCSALILRRKFV